MTNRQRARLIPVGKTSTSEAELRATSALLAVLSVVRPFSKVILSPLGASKSDRAIVDAYTEVPFKHSSGQVVRPDGLIEVKQGKRDPFTALVEVKTGTSALDPQQIQNYLDVARAHSYDCIITISNEIAPAPGVHPTPGVKVRANSLVKLHHFSWTRILSEAVKVKVHRGVEDPEQAWILGELIRYLEHSTSGAMHLDDMGLAWTAVRDGAREGTLQPKGDDVRSIAQIWDQLLHFVALRLGSEIGSDVQEVIPRKQQQDATLRTREFVDTLCDSGTLAGTLRIPETVGDLELVADLRARQSVLRVSLDAPTDRGAKARASWLIRQLRDAPGVITLESYAKNVRTPVVVSLENARLDLAALVGPEKRDPVKFRIVARRELGLNRRSGRGKGFVESISDAVELFYAEVVQKLLAWNPPAPKLRQMEPQEVSDTTSDVEAATSSSLPEDLNAESTPR